MQEFVKSRKLSDVCYDIRGPVHERATVLEEEGHRILRLNIGNPAPFGFDAPEEILVDVIHNIPQAQGYADSKGVYSARKAVMQHYQQRLVANVEIGDVYLGNGVSELIVMAMQALLDDGDEVLVPAPDYPLWTAAVTLSGGRAVHYRCDESLDWQPDLDHLRSLIGKRTRALVVINPNNPTGAVYPEATLRALAGIAAEHDLVLLADEIYDKILYDDAEHHCLASFSEDLLCLTFNGLSKAYRLAGFRSGWLLVSGGKHRAADFIEGLDILASMRLCANVPAQYAIQTALGGYQSIRDLVLPGGRMREQRDRAYELITAIPGVSCVMPRGAIYLFPRLDPDVYHVPDDEQLIYCLLEEERMLLVQGSAFNWPDTDHLRVVFLPRIEELEDAIGRLARFLERWRRLGA